MAMVLIDLPRYRDLSILGSGGMATVSLARDTVLGREVALKRLNFVGDARALTRFRREALIGASVSHPNLVSIYDVIVDDGEVVIVMEYVRGETLQAALAREGRLSPAAALRVLDGVGAGLDAIHRRGIVHRDVKPANILLGVAGAIKLADLGIASSPERTRITTEGSFMGSFPYMAPEQLEEAETTPAIDVYALSAVAFEALSGQKARQEPNPLALAHAIATQPPPDLRQVWPEAPEPVADVLRRGMERDTALRPGSAGELVARLRAAFEPMATRASTLPHPSPSVASSPRSLRPAAAAPAPARFVSRRRPGRYVAPALLLGAVAVAIILALSAGGSSRSRTLAPGSARASHKGRGTGAVAGPGAHPAGGGGSSSPGSTASPAASGSGASASTPVGAVEIFYALAASHHYSQAWALADLTFRRQLQGYDSFRSGQAGDISIHFESASVTSQSAGGATVAVSTTSTRTDGVRHCNGTVDLVKASDSSWLLHMIHINCS